MHKSRTVLPQTVTCSKNERKKENAHDKHQQHENGINLSFIDGSIFRLSTVLGMEQTCRHFLNLNMCYFEVETL